MIDDDLLQRLKNLEQRVAEASRRFRAVDNHTDDAFRGMYLTDDHIDRLLESSIATRPEPAESLPVTAGSVLDRLAVGFDLLPIDIDILVVAMAPDLDRRFEQFYGYLHDDLTRRRASPGLVIDLLGLTAFDGSLRYRFAADAPLRRHGLVEVDDAERPFLTRSLRVPDRVLSHLLDDEHADAALQQVTVECGIEPAVEPTGASGGLAERLGRAVETPGTVIYLREQHDAGAADLAAAAVASTGRQSIVVDLTRAPAEERQGLAAVAVREAQLIGGGLVVGPIDELDGVVVADLAEHDVAVIFHGRAIWNPDSTRAPALVVDLDPLSSDEQHHRWVAEADHGLDDVATLTRTFRLGPGQIKRAVAAGRAHAAMLGRAPNAASFAVGARTQNAVGLERLSRRVVPDACWDDIVLPDATMTQLRHLVTRVAYRRQVLDRWGLRRGGGRGEGIAALFAGDSGTGKTLAAEVVANALGLDLYVIDLSSVVDKYIGETEKNLDRVFNEAEGVNGVLFFDEADALFGKRSEISDAKDRYANMEVAYLLQRMEQFDGLAILASNLRGNLDEAFARRLSLVVDFADPDTTQRRSLWQVLLADAPLQPDVDLDFLAGRFTLSGGNIRNIAVTAAYLAAERGTDIDMVMLIRGVQFEYRKLGRLCLATEFGEYLEHLEHLDTEGAGHGS